MKKGKIFIFISLIILILFIGSAATCNFCGVPVAVGEDNSGSQSDSGVSGNNNNSSSSSDDSEQSSGQAGSGEEALPGSSEADSEGNGESQQEEDPEELPGEGQDDNDNQDMEEDQEEAIPEEGDPTIRETDVRLVNTETGKMFKEIHNNEIKFGSGSVLVGYDFGDFYIYNPEEDDPTLVKVYDLVKGFISFDISALSGADIQEAVLFLSGCSVIGDPSYFNKMYINIINWGTGAPSTDYFDSAGTIVQGYPSSSNGNIQCNSVELKKGLQGSIDSGSQRFQLRLHFSGTLKSTDMDEDDLWYYDPGNIILNIKYTQ